MTLSFKLIIFFIFIYESHCLYEDQVGKFDWKKSYVGKIKYSFISLASTDGPVIFVATENNVIAALNLNDGSIKWRKVLESNELGDIKAFSIGSEMTTLSGHNHYLLLRGWNLKTGVLSYEWTIPINGEGDIKWNIEGSNLFQVRFLGKILEVTIYDIKTGTVIGSSNTITAPWLDKSSKCLLDHGTIICISDNGTVTSYCLTSHKPRSQHNTLLSTKVSSLAPLPSPFPSALVTDSFGRRKALIIRDGDIIVSELPEKTVGAVHDSSQGPVLIRAVYSDGNYELSGVILKSNVPVPSLNIHGITKLSESIMSSLACTGNAPDSLCYIAMVGEDESLVLLYGDKVRWVREEALANIIAVEMIDLPVSDEEAAIEKEFANKEGGIVGMLYRRVYSQCLQAMNAVVSILGLKEHTGESRADLVKDPFGLHKLMIVVTKIAKIYGIENNDGDIIWQHHLKSVSPLLMLDSLYVPIFVQRSSRHLPFPAICTLLFKLKETNNAALYSLDPISGNPLFGGLNAYDFKVKQSFLLPKENEEFIRGLLLIKENNGVEIIPSETKEVALDIHKNLFIYTADASKGDLNGFSFIESEGDLKAVQLWNIHLNAPIVSIVQKNKAERVHSQGRVLGDRSVLYKYINPHLVAVATHVIDSVHKNLVSIYLIDSVSGGIIFSASHKRAMPPIHFVNSENWVVYSFFNEKSRRTEIVSLDLYEGKTMRNSTEFSSLTYLVEPIVEKQAYIFPYNIMAMKETITEKGITNKHVLVGVSTGSVMEIPWSLLDPHRTTDLREEGVLPYTPDLTLPQEATITYNHSLPFISGIHASPSGLESTSLVLIYGLDLFYTRVAPSKTFDVLKDDFEYWLITAVLGGLISAAYITKKLASRKALKQAWK